MGGPECSASLRLCVKKREVLNAEAQSRRDERSFHHVDPHSR